MFAFLSGHDFQRSILARAAAVPSFASIFIVPSRWLSRTLYLSLISHLSIEKSFSLLVIHFSIEQSFSLTRNPPFSLSTLPSPPLDRRSFARYHFTPIGTQPISRLPKRDDDKVRHKVVLLDVAHTKREIGGFKTRHLYPPRDFYDSLANRCGAVVVGSCRIGGTSEVDLTILRKEATKFWDAVGQKGDARNRRGGGGGSDTASATSSRGGDTGRRRRTSSSEGTTGTTGRDADDSLADSNSESDGGGGSSDHSCASATGNNNSSGSDSGRGDESADSGTSGTDRSQGRSSGGGSDGESLREGSTNQRGKRKNGERPSRRRKRRGRRTRRGARGTISQTLSGGRKKRGGGGLTRWSSGVVGSMRLISHGSGGSGNSSGDSDASRTNTKRIARKRERQQQHEERGLARACAPVSERAIYEENMSVFGRTIRDALSGECTENVHLPRVLLVDLYRFVRREFAPYGRPRLPENNKAEESVGDGNGGGAREARARKEVAAAEAAAEKAAAKKKAQRRAKMGAKAAKEEDRLEKEADQLKQAEEEERRRTQVGRTGK